MAAVQLILTIQSKEKRSLTHKTFQKIQEPISTTKRCEECRNYYIRTFKRKRKIRGNPPIFNFTFPDSDNESTTGETKTTNASNNNDIALKDFPFGAPQDPTVQAMKDPPKIVITRTPTKTFLTERVPEV